MFFFPIHVLNSLFLLSKELALAAFTNKVRYYIFFHITIIVLNVNNYEHQWQIVS